MSVSDDSAGKPETKRERWKRIRYQYETTDVSHRDLAKAEGVSRSTLSKRAMREKWSQRAKIVSQTASRLEKEIGDRIQHEIRDELAPWIEERRKEITKRGFKVSARGLDRVESMFDSDSILDPKSESYLSKAAETYVRVGRVSLGMNDGAGLNGPINLNILTNQAAVQVVPS